MDHRSGVTKRFFGAGGITSTLGIPAPEEWDFDFFDKEPEEQVNDNFSNVIVVDGLPKVPESKFDKLNGVLKKIFSKFGSWNQSEGFLHPQDPETGKTLGYCMIEYKESQMAHEAVIKADNMPLDKKHKFRVTLCSESDSVINYDTNYVEPSADDHTAGPNTLQWLQDTLGRDQFVVRHGHETEVFWNDPMRGGKSLDYDGAREKASGKQWTQLVVQWSTQGSFLATFHAQGIALWGGPQFAKIQRFMHPGVQLIDFSPQENFIVTFNAREPENKGDAECIIVWHAKTGKKLRGFKGGYSLKAGKWPIFKWSNDESFFGRLGEDMIQIYESSTGGLLDKKSIKLPGVSEFEFSPTDNVISYNMPEKEPKPARVCLMELPSRRVIRDKSLFGVANVSQHWQKSGDFLCVRCARINKNKKAAGTSFEIFHTHVKDIPVDTLEIKERVQAIAFEPVGNRFAIIHGEAARPDVSFYEIKKTKIKLLSTLVSIPANCLFWSPRGQHIVIAGLGTHSGQFTFYDVKRKEILAQSTHYMATDVEWDPSGRFVATAVTQPLQQGSMAKRSNENGFKVWNNLGEELHSDKYDALFQFLWRPRPASLLTKAEIKDVEKNLKQTHWNKFKAADDAETLKKSSGKAKERKKMLSEWRRWRADKKRQVAEQRAAWLAHVGGYDSNDDDQFEIEEHVIEEELQSYEEIVDGDVAFE